MGNKSKFVFGWNGKCINRDTEYVRWYPINFKLLQTEQVFKPKDIAFYIHIPFCNNFCPFCPFIKEKFNLEMMNDLVQNLTKEIKLYEQKGLLSNYKLQSIYFGGGSPNLLLPNQIEQLVEIVLQSISPAKSLEISMEARPLPGISEYILSILKVIKLTRVSLGVQSFQDDLLRNLGCLHKSKEAEIEVRNLVNNTELSVSIDLLYRIPGQNINMWFADLKHATDIGVHHLSCYPLILTPEEPLTKLVRNGKIHSQPSEDTEREMMNMVFDTLPLYGYKPYTFSDFSKQGHECVYQQRHWSGPQIEYIGIGPGAFSFFQDYQYCNVGTVDAYNEIIKSGDFPLLCGAKLNVAEHMARFMALGFKTLMIRNKAFKETFGYDAEKIYHEELEALCENGLIVKTAKGYELTREGIWNIDNVSKTFFTEENRFKATPTETDILKATGTKRI